MSLSARSRYGTRAMMELALDEQQRKPVQLAALAENQAIPLRYLAKIAQDLKRAGFIRSVRGAHGGYLLARAASEIEIVEIVHALDGSVTSVDCVDDPRACPKADECVTRKLWSQVNRAMMGVLESTTLQDLADRERARRKAQARRGRLKGGKA